MVEFLANLEAQKVWVPPLVYFLITFGVGWLIRGVVFRGLTRAASRTDTIIDDEILRKLRWPALMWILLASIIVALARVPQDQIPEWATRPLQVILQGLLIFSIAGTLANITLVLIRYMAVERDTGPREITALTALAVRTFWFVPAGAFLLNSVGIGIAPLLTALGAGGIGLGFALKDTASNLLAGIYVNSTGFMQKGDFVRLSSGEEGFVEDIRWRVTSLRTLQNNLILIPNGKLSEAIVTNYYHPEKKMAVVIRVPVSYDSDVDRIELVLLEEASMAYGQVEGLLMDPPPVVRFNPGFGESSLDLSLIVQVEEYTKQFGVIDALRRRIHRRFRAEGIEIPFPQQVLHFNDKALDALQGQKQPPSS